MQKIADGLVKGRKAILALMLVLTVISVFSMSHVNVITDMTEYLPDDSPMKQGMDIMEEEFPEMDTDSSIRLMFTDLTEEQKENLKPKLEKLQYVDSVDYQADSEDYNKENHTLYALNIPYDYGSKEIEQVETALGSDFSDYDMVYSVEDSSLGDIPAWMIGAALLILMLILFLMSSSWAEPFLFLITIGIAIVLNMGTNALFSGVSSITHSICAILQLVLSMDYSIILMNRYRQELKKDSDKEKAMKHALSAAFSSITSSSVTTIVGLLVLCFMSFKIGMDMGLVLAKGVLISLICVFTVLPALILMFDKWIQRTGKKVIPLSMGKIGAFSFKARYGILMVFLVCFVALSLAKGNTDISYTMTAPNEINEVFPKSNTIVALYDNQDEEAVEDMVSGLEKEDGVKNVMTYGNTLGKQYTAGELADALGDMKQDTDIEISADMLNLIYYDYFESGKTSPMTLSEFMAFLQNDIAQNESFSSMIEEESLKQLGQLVPFSSKEELMKERDSKELSQLFGMDETALNQLFAMSGQSTMSIQSLLEMFSTNPAAAGSLSDGEAAQAQMQMIQIIVSSVMQDKEYTSSELSELFSSVSDMLDEQTMELLYTYHDSQKGADASWKMSMEVLLDHITESMMNNPKYASVFTDEMKTSLEDAGRQLGDGKEQLVGKDHSIMMISTALPEESEETTAFMEKLEKECNEKLTNGFYLIGSSPMAYEMSQTFGDELNKMTLMTAAAIFIVILITFRSVCIPLILVLLIQAAVYTTMIVIGIQGLNIYYLALLIVQSILMGSTIDYGILYTSYYREKRESMGIKEALVGAYNGSIHTTLTSGLIMVVVTAVMGYAFSDPTVGQICHTISKGAAAAIILVIFFLPGILASLDKLICRKKK